MSRCCSSCFNDSFLEKHITKHFLFSTDHSCDYCATTSNTIPVLLLVDYFWPILDLYHEDENGFPMAYLLQSDWGISDHLSEDLLSKLLEDMTGEEYSKLKYSSNDYFSHDHIDKWKSFSKELKHGNRFFPNTEIDIGMLKEAISYLELLKVPKKLFRSRAMEDNEVFEAKNMLAPPEKKVRNGRANPIGIPYLYAATDCETAIAELRPHRGEEICVIELELDSVNLNIADLSNPNFTSHIFEFEENVRIRLHSLLGFIKHLGKELSKPIQPRTADLDYLPTQFLCELIKTTNVFFSKDKKFDGVLYNSSIGKGQNIALFNNHKILNKGNIKVYKVDKLYFESSEITSQ